MIAIGYAAAPAYWISARYVPVSVIVRSYDEVDPALENVIEHHSNYKEGSWNKKNALPFEESAGFKEDYPEEAGGQVNPE